MRKQRLAERALKYSRQHEFFACSESVAAEAGWLAGYRAAQKDAHEKTYNRKFCDFCGKEKDGHKHRFCPECKRIKEHCECDLFRKAGAK